MFPLGESTLAFDEEMLQVLDAVDGVKPAPNNACPTTDTAAQGEPASPASYNKRESDRAPLQPAGHRPHIAPMIQRRGCGRSSDCQRTGWAVDCKDLAQKLLFSEDAEKTEHAQRGQDNVQSLPDSDCIKVGSSQEIKSSFHGSSNM